MAGFRYREDLSAPEFGYRFAHSRDGRQIRFSAAGRKVVEVDLESVLQVQLKCDERLVYRGDAIDSLAAAAGGGIAFGGAGAVVGALAAERIGANAIGSITIELRLNDLDQPSLSIPFVEANSQVQDPKVRARMQLAERWTDMIEVLRHRLSAKST
jgi:hypothetical protein